MGIRPVTQHRCGWRTLE